MLVVGQPTAVDPSRAPAGKHVLWVQVRVLPAEIAGDAAGEIAPAHWDEVKERYADRVIGMIETYAPGLKQKILGRSVFSPIDLERENPNLVGGDQICGSHHLVAEFPVPPGARLRALEHAGREAASCRRRDLAGRRRRRRIGIHARPTAWREVAATGMDQAEQGLRPADAGPRSSTTTNEKGNAQ